VRGIFSKFEGVVEISNSKGSQSKENLPFFFSDIYSEFTTESCMLLLRRFNFLSPSIFSQKAIARVRNCLINLIIPHPFLSNTFYFSFQPVLQRGYISHLMLLDFSRHL